MCLRQEVVSLVAPTLNQRWLDLKGRLRDRLALFALGERLCPLTQSWKVAKGLTDLADTEEDTCGQRGLTGRTHAVVQLG